MKRRGSPLLYHRPQYGDKDPITVWSWVVVSDPDMANPLELAMVISGPEFERMDGRAIADVWTLHDGTKRPGSDLTVLDLVDVANDGRSLLKEIGCGIFGAEFNIRALRLSRAASLATSAIVKDADGVLIGIAGQSWDCCSSRGHSANDQLHALVDVARAVYRAVCRWKEFVTVGIPNLTRALYQVGMCEVAKSILWVYAQLDAGDDPSTPHPRSVEICALIAGR